MDRIDKMRDPKEIERAIRIADEGIRLHKSRGDMKLVEEWMKRRNKLTNKKLK